MSEGPRLNADLMFEDVFKEIPEHLQKQRDLMRLESGMRPESSPGASRSEGT
jgi:hypothetical protein